MAPLTDRAAEVKPQANAQGDSTCTQNSTKDTRDAHQAERTTTNSGAQQILSTVPLELYDSSKCSTQTKETLDLNQLRQDVIAIHKASGVDFVDPDVGAPNPDNRAISQILQGKSDDQRHAINELYREKYGTTLEQAAKEFETGTDLENLNNILNRKDGDRENQSARRIHQDLMETSNLFGRSNSEIEKDVRDTLATMSSKQVEKAESEYKQLYGTSMLDAIKNDPNLSQSEKTFAGILAKGNDQRSDADTKQMVELALRENRSDLFNDAMRDASTKARTDFLGNGGEDQLRLHFSGRELQGTIDYAHEGKLDTATQVRDNGGFFSNNDKGIELAIQSMTKEERQLYAMGKSLSEGTKVADATPEQQANAKALYQHLHSALTDTGNATEVTKWENMISGQKEAAKEPSLVQALEDNNHWYGSNRQGTLDAISNMSKEDQEHYRNDAQYRAQIDSAVQKNLVFGAELVVAQQMLKQVSDGQKPSEDVVSQMKILLQKVSVDKGEAVRNIEKAFAQDPSMRERLQNPTTEADKAFAKEFHKNAYFVFGKEYDSCIKPLIETGRVPLETRMGLNQGLFSNDYDQAFADLKNATPAEKTRLQNDSQYREKVLGFMSEDRQKIAMSVVGQGNMNAEDKIRAAVIGWGGSGDIVSELKGIAPDQLSHVQQEYARKYGSSLDGDLMSKLSGQEKVDAQRVLNQNLDGNVRADIARTETESTRSGFGAWTSDHVWGSATGEQADNAMNQTVKAQADRSKLESAIAQGNGLVANATPAELQAMQAKVNEQLSNAVKSQNTATDNHVETKQAAGEYVSDAAVTAAAVGSLVLSGGADAPLLVALAGAGAAIKVGTNAAMQGNDYDWSSTHVMKDAATGMVSAVAGAVGPGEVAAIFNIGRTAATEAAEMTVAQIGAGTLAQGGREALAAGTKEIVTDALASGATKLEERQFVALAEKVVVEGVANREAAVAELAAKLEQNVSTQIGQGIVRRATQTALNAGGGAFSGGAGGVVEGASDWDSRKSVTANVGHIVQKVGEGAVTGAIAGAVSGAIMTEASDLVQRVKGDVHVGGSVPEATELKPAVTELAGATPVEEKVTVTGTVALSAATGLSDQTTQDVMTQVTAVKGHDVPAKPAPTHEVVAPHPAKNPVETKAEIHEPKPVKVEAHAKPQGGKVKVEKGFTAFVPDEQSRTNLLTAFDKYSQENGIAKIENGKQVAEHITAEFKVPKDKPLPQVDSVKVVAFVNDQERGVQAAVVEVNGSTQTPDGRTYHITMYLAPGTPAKASNDAILNSSWQEHKLAEPIELNVQSKFMSLQGAKPQAEVAPKPVVEAAPKPVVEAAPKPAVEAAPKPALEATPKPTLEATAAAPVETAKPAVKPEGAVDAPPARDYAKEQALRLQAKANREELEALPRVKETPEPTQDDLRARGLLPEPGVNTTELYKQWDAKVNELADAFIASGKEPKPNEVGNALWLASKVNWHKMWFGDDVPEAMSILENGFFPTRSVTTPSGTLEYGKLANENSFAARVTEKDGTVHLYVKDNGGAEQSVVLTRKPDGSVTAEPYQDPSITNADGSKTHLLGKELITDSKDGTQTSITDRHDAPKSVRHPDGTTDTYFANGAVRTDRPDGSLQVSTPGGSILTGKEARDYLRSH